jgi:hypothetical protein
MFNVACEHKKGKKEEKKKEGWRYERMKLVMQNGVAIILVVRFVIQRETPQESPYQDGIEQIGAIGG